MDFPNVFRPIWDVDTLLGKDRTIVKFACLLAFLIISTFVFFTLNGTTVYAQSDDKEDGKDDNVEQEKGEDKQIYKLRVGYKSYSIKYSIKGGELVNMTIPRSDILEVFIKPISSGSITIEIPKSISLLKGTIFDFDEIRTITLDFDSNTTSVKVRGLTQVSNLGNPKETKDEQANENLLGVTSENISRLNNLNSNLISNISLSDLPQTIELVDPGWENYNLTLRAIVNNRNITYQDNYKSGSAGASDWNPLLLFQVPSVKPGLGLIDIGHVGIVPIKLYKDSNEMMKNIHLWKNIGLNEEVVFRLPNRGLNLILAEVQFSNGIKGIYGAAFTVDVHESKSEGTQMFNEQRSQDKKLVIREVKLSKSAIKSEDQEFLAAVEYISCIVHKSQGFNVCQ